MTCAYREVRDFVLDDLTKAMKKYTEEWTRKDSDVVLTEVVKALEAHYMKVVGTSDPLRETVQV